jgi:uncharacterized iron-regulated membrane protein
MATKKTLQQKLRAGILWVHRWLGITSGLIVLVVSLTGCIYVFEQEIRNTFQRKYYYVANSNTPKIELQQLRQIVKAQIDKDKIKLIRFEEKNTAAYIFVTEKDNLISVNPYTGQVVGVRNGKKDFLNVVLRLHRTLLLGEVGRQIVKWNVVIFLMLCISGLVLWWPKQKHFFKRAATINFKTKNWKVLNWDLHSVLGFYGLLVLILIALTGIFFSFDTVKDALKAATGQPKGKKEEKLKSNPVTNKTFVLDIAYRQMQSTYPGAKETVIVMPKDSIEPLRINMQYAYTIIRKQNQLFFDQYSGDVLKKVVHEKYNTYDKISRSNYQLHTGDMPGLGIGSKIIFFLASLFAASLPITGFLIWWGRTKKKNKFILTI